MPPHPIILCCTCGKRKRHNVAAYAARHETWECNACAKGRRRARQPLVTVPSANCATTLELRAGLVVKHDYYLCKTCDRAHAYPHPPVAEGEIRICDLWAIGGHGGWVGYTRRPGTPEELANVAQARDIRDQGIAELLGRRDGASGTPSDIEAESP